MTAVVLAFAGAIGNGKSTVSAALAAALGCPRTGFGDYIREEAQRRGLDPTSREVLQVVGEQMVLAGWEPFCRAVLARGAWKPGESLVVDGIRHVKAVETLHMLVAPATLSLIYLEAPPTVRESRLRQKGITDDEQRHRIETHSTEVEVSTLLPRIADLRMHSEVTQDVTVQQIIAWLNRSPK